MSEKKSIDRKRRFSLSSLDEAKQRSAVQAFARQFGRMLQSTDRDGAELSRKDVMTQVSKEIEDSIDVRQFDTFLKEAHKRGYLRLGYERLTERAQRLRTIHSNLHDVAVVAGNDEILFGRAAAEEFIREMFRIAGTKHKSESDVLNVGIVSGSTTGDVIRSAVQLDWRKDLGVSAKSLPMVRVFALNVCLTVPEHLSGNATILANELAVKIRRDHGQASAFGLSAPLLVPLDELESVDQSPQTFDVVRYTEPYRVINKLRRENLLPNDVEPKPYDTELDIVLTGVGEVPRSSSESGGASERQQHSGESGGSIFYNLAKQFGLEMDKMIESGSIVGDIAFAAINWNGEIVPLSRSDSDSGSKRFVFYSAIQPQVLEKMATDQSKSVILVARHSPEKNKLPAIKASISNQNHRYASRLVIDQDTADGLTPAGN